jgi:hypothetical protein
LGGRRRDTPCLGFSIRGYKLIILLRVSAPLRVEKEEARFSKEVLCKTSEIRKPDLHLVVPIWERAGEKFSNSRG